jgi:glycosyltransferase involved in cell wall biosynthesis
VRILHVIDSLEFGGAEKVLVALANGFARQHEVSVCCVSRIGDLVRELDPRIEVCCMNRPEGNDYLLPWRLARRMQRQRYDVVHTHNWGVFLEGGIAGWLARTPVAIHTVHGPYAPRGPGAVQWAKRVFRHTVERLIALRFRRVVAVSDSIRKYIPQTVGIDRERVCTVHNGIEGMATPLAANAGPTRFIAVGRLDAIKNHAMMIHAFAGVVARGVRARLTIVGDGPQRGAIEALVDALGLRGQIELTGFRTDVSELLAQADVFVLSSHYEGISIALLEAMRAGLTAVATRVGGVPETVVSAQTGLLVDDADEAAFAQAMERLAASPTLRREMGLAAQALQQREFSLDTMLERYDALYAGQVVTS